MEKAVVLLSGGMDSAVALYIAKERHGEVMALIFDYGQKARKEVKRAKSIADHAFAPFDIVKVSFPWKGSSLLDGSSDIPEGVLSREGDIPSTYVPARNIIFLSYGVSCAEAMGAGYVYIGAHEQDYSNYPDCRSVFFEKFQDAVEEGTKEGLLGGGVKICAPIINMTKKEIIEKGLALGVPFDLTWSCYRGGETPCGRCESCMLRAKGFAEAGVEDPALLKTDRTLRWKPQR